VAVLKAASINAQQKARSLVTGLSAWISAAILISLDALAISGHSDSFELPVA
jgi:hypothetical protein